MRYILLAVPALLIWHICSYAQEQPSVANQAIDFPSKFFSRIDKTTASLDKNLSDLKSIYQGYSRQAFTYKWKNYYHRHCGIAIILGGIV